MGNSNAGEADVARLAITRLLASVKLDWHDLTELLFNTEESILDVLSRLFAKDEDILIRLGLSGAVFFSSAEGPFADVILDGHRNTWPLASSDFLDWLLHQFYIEKKKAPSSFAVKSAIRTLGAQAKFEGARHEVHLRAARLNDRIYFDVGNPEWSVIGVDALGWRIIRDPPVRLRRTAGLTALPLPTSGGSLDQLRPLLNVTEEGFTLFISWLLDAMYPGRPHPLLYFAGEEGSAKSTAAKIARSLVDPNHIPLRNPPATVRDLFVGARSSYVMAFDNLSVITPTISDALCQLASGSGFGTRKLFSDSGETLISGCRPVILNGLLNAIDRSDLADRAIIVQMSRIAPQVRHSEAQVWNQFELNRSHIFGALLDCLSRGLRNLPNVKLPQLPRMADFALWSVACEPFPPGAFIAALENAATEANEAIAESDAVAVSIAAFMTSRSTWTGTAAALLYDLSVRDRTEAEPSGWKTWPREPSSFGKRLRLASRVLRKMGIDVVIGKASDRRRTRTITLSKMEPTAPRPGSSDRSDRSDTTRVPPMLVQL